VILVYRQAIHPLVLTRLVINGDDAVREDHSSFPYRQSITDFYLHGPDLSQVINIPDQHGMIRGDLQFFSPLCFKPDQVLWCPVNRDCGEFSQVNHPAAVHAPDTGRSDRVSIERAGVVHTGLSEIKPFKDKLANRHFMHAGLVRILNQGITMQAVPPLGGMEERVSVPDVRLGKPDDTGQDSGTGMRSEPDDQMADQVFAIFTPVKGLKTVKFLEELVDEPGTGKQIITASFRDQDILCRKFEDLIRGGEGYFVDIMGVSEFDEPFRFYTDFPGSEVG